MISSVSIFVIDFYHCQNINEWETCSSVVSTCSDKSVIKFLNEGRVYEWLSKYINPFPLFSKTGCKTMICLICFLLFFCMNVGRKKILGAWDKLIVSWINDREINSYTS